MNATTCLLAVIIQPLLVKAVLILNIFKSDPLLKLSGLGSAKFVGMQGATTLDPNIAYTSQALGGYAAKTFWQGGSLWWNPFEGVGAPLAGEMQSAAFFPPTWLLILPNGQLIEHLLFQIIAGVATFLLVRRLGLGLAASWFAGTACSFNGTYAWLANAVINPICFLPVVLLGVELIRSAVRHERLIGGCCIALGIAASLYAGFPETAYLDGLLIAGWTLVRAGDVWPKWSDMASFLFRVGMFAACGCLLAAPLLVAFVDFLNVSNVGLHDGNGVGSPITLVDFAMFLVPYLPGAITHNPPVFWGNVGGYAGIGIVALAGAGLAGRSERRLRLFLMAWSLIALALIYDVPPIPSLTAWIPGMRVVVAFRYIDPALVMALIVLAALALDDLAKSNVSAAWLQRCFLGTIAVAAISGVFAVMHGIYPLQKIEAAPLVLHALVIALLGLVVFRKRLGAETRAWMMALAVSAEAVALFVVPMVSYPLKRDVDLRTITFLQRNLGTQRFVSTSDLYFQNSIAANYGSYFGIAQVNWNDLPVPQAWVDYVRRHIDRSSDAIVFRVTPEQFLASMAAYAAIGTKYVTTPLDHPIAGLPLVHADSLMRTYQLPQVRPYFTAPGCQVKWSDRTTATTRCQAASRLERLELLMPGWTAEQNGRSVSVERTGEIFQAVSVPAGAMTTRFNFQPPSLWIGRLLVLLGLTGLVVMFWCEGRLLRLRPTSRLAST